MKKFFTKIIAVGSALVVPSLSFAAAWDGYDTVGTAIGAELTAALGIVAAILAITMGVPIGIRLVRKIAH